MKKSKQSRSAHFEDSVSLLPLTIAIANDALRSVCAGPVSNEDIRSAAGLNAKTRVARSR